VGVKFVLMKDGVWSDMLDGNYIKNRVIRRMNLGGRVADSRDREVQIGQKLAVDEVQSQVGIAGKGRTPVVMCRFPRHPQLYPPMGLKMPYGFVILPPIDFPLDQLSCFNCDFKCCFLPLRISGDMASAVITGVATEQPSVHSNPDLHTLSNVSNEILADSKVK
jgi:hypothetical protein